MLISQNYKEEKPMKKEARKTFHVVLENYLKQKGIDVINKIEGKDYNVYFCPTCQEEGHGMNRQHLYFNIKKQYLKCLYEKNGVPCKHGTDIYNEVKRLMEEND